MCPDDDSQQPSESAPDDAGAAASEVSADPDAPLFETPELDVSLREAEHGNEHRGGDD
jgi:hypothetical protein